MKVWFTIFVVLFLATEGLQLLKGVDLPTPVFVVAGVILAIASNWNRRAGIPFKWFGIFLDDGGAITQPPQHPAPEPSKPVQFQELKPRSNGSDTPSKMSTASKKVL
ncbi:MAG: hypothetical protein ACFCA4_03800 [Cyanophyceae cyanobacterium]